MIDGMPRRYNVQSGFVFFGTVCRCDSRLYTCVLVRDGARYAFVVKIQTNFDDVLHVS